MGCRGTKDYSFQAWVVALTSLFSCLVGVAQIAFGIWLVFFSRSIAPILGGESHTDVHYGYIGLGVFTCLAALLGCTASVIRRVNCLIMYVTILFASIAFQCAIGAFIFVEQDKTSENLIMRIDDNPEIAEHVDFHFNCRLGQNDTMFEMEELEICSVFVQRQLWNLVWAELGLCGAVVCLQFVLFTMAIMMCLLVKKAQKRTGRIHPTTSRRLLVQERGGNNLDNLETETTSSFFTGTTPPITPSGPSSASSTMPPHFNLATNHTPSVSPHYNNYHHQQSGRKNRGKRGSITKL